MMTSGRCSSAFSRTTSMSTRNVSRVHAVGADLVQLAGEVDPHAVREVAAVRQLEAEDLVARVDQRVQHGGVGRRARVRLDVGVLGAEQRLGAGDRDGLRDVDLLAAAVVAAAGVALGVLVGEHGALRLQDRAGHEVLARDHLERALLAGELTVEDGGDLRVQLGDVLIHQRDLVGAHEHSCRQSACTRASGTRTLVCGDRGPRRPTRWSAAASLPGGDPPASPVATGTD